MITRWLTRRELRAIGELGASTPDGERARVTGVVRVLDRALRAPTSGRPCVAFMVSVREPVEPYGLDTARLFDCTELVPFAVECALGRVVIDSQFAELVNVPAHETVHLHADAWSVFCRERRLTPGASGIESAVLAGTTVSIAGTSWRRSVAPRQEAGFRDTATTYCLVGNRDRPLLLLHER